MEWLSQSGFGDRYWVPCYRGPVDGWQNSEFHGKCDDKGPTITLARQAHSNQKDSYIFGGFNDHSWKSENSFYVFGLSLKLHNIFTSVYSCIKR